MRRKVVVIGVVVMVCCQVDPLPGVIFLPFSWHDEEEGGGGVGEVGFV